MYTWSVWLWIDGGSDADGSYTWVSENREVVGREKMAETLYAKDNANR